MRRGPVLMLVWLVVLWVVLWRDVSVANVASGVLLAVLTAQGFTVDTPASSHRIRPLQAAVLLGYFLWKLVEANLVLAREIVTPRNSIETGIVAVPLVGASDLVATIVANCVSLTPGSLTLHVRREEHPTLYVHVLHLHDVQDARREVLALHDRVRAALVQRVVAAASDSDEVKR